MNTKLGRTQRGEQRAGGDAGQSFRTEKGRLCELGISGAELRITHSSKSAVILDRQIQTKA